MNTFSDTGQLITGDYPPVKNWDNHVVDYFYIYNMGKFWYIAYNAKTNETAVCRRLEGAGVDGLEADGDYRDQLEMFALHQPMDGTGLNETLEYFKTITQVRDI